MEDPGPEGHEAIEHTHEMASYATETLSRHSQVIRFKAAWLPFILVSAWGYGELLGLLLGQTKVEAKSNEMHSHTAPALKILEVSGCIVTIDANGVSRRSLPSTIH